MSIFTRDTKRDDQPQVHHSQYITTNNQPDDADTKPVEQPAVAEPKAPGA